MARGYTRITDSPFYRVALAQIVLTALASLIGLVLVDTVAAISALVAGFSCIVPAIYVLIVSLRPVTVGETGLGLVLRGEVGKYGLTIALLMAVFVFIKPLNVVAFFGTFAVMQVCHAVIPLLEARKLQKR